MMLDAHWQNNCWWLSMGLPRLHYAQIVTAMYLKISVGDFLSLFACRTGAKPFFAFAPSPVLLVLALLSLTVSTVVAIAWQRSTLDKIETLGVAQLNGDDPRQRYRHILVPVFIWYYCIVWWFIQDALKMLACVAADRFGKWWGERATRRGTAIPSLSPASVSLRKESGLTLRGIPKAAGGGTGDAAAADAGGATLPNLPPPRSQQPAEESPPSPSKKTTVIHVRSEDEEENGGSGSDTANDDDQEDDDAAATPPDALPPPAPAAAKVEGHQRSMTSPPVPPALVPIAHAMAAANPDGRGGEGGGTAAPAKSSRSPPPAALHSEI
jgi:hypothetical protein